MTAPAPSDAAPKIVALTGATGFIGRHIVTALKTRGIKIRALTRRAQMAEDGVDWIAGSLSDAQALATLIEGADAVIHCAGLVKARSRDEFFDANAGAVSRIIAAIKVEARGARLVHISSMAAREPGLSDYAASKAAGETLLRETSDLFWTGLRPPAVYGPGDMEILKMFKSLKYGVGFLPGTSAGRVSFIHVSDLTMAIMAVLEAPKTAVHGLIHELDDGHPGGYRIGDVYDVSARVLGRRVRLLTVPRPLLTGAAHLNHVLSRFRNEAPMLTAGKVRELTHPDWVARSPRLNETGLWHPQIDLPTGLAETLAWYRHNLLF